VRDRHRKELGDLDALAASMRGLGLLQPIGITRDNALVFGERRLQAARLLNWETIPARVIAELGDDLRPERGLSLPGRPERAAAGAGPTARP
jgi:ParB family chromosome partitioning protein